MIKFITRLLRCLRPLFSHSGIRFEQMLSIVSLKLTIDDRIEKNGKGGRNSSNTLLKQSLTMFFIGGLFFLGIYAFGSLSTALVVFHSYLSITVITAFMAEYSNLLFSTTDNSIMERFPVDNRTLLSARIISMLSYLFLITFSLSCLPFIILIFKEGIAVTLLFVLAVIINTLFSLLLANLFYIGLVRFLPAEKFQKIIVYAQTILIVFMVAGYQFIGQFSKNTIDFFTSPSLWMYFVPSCYFTAFTELTQTTRSYPLLFSGIGLGMTFLMLILTFKSFSKSYIQNASQIDKVYAGKAIKRKEKTARFLARISCPDPIQQNGFMLTWRMTHDNLKFKQSVFPIVIYIIIFNFFPIKEILSNPDQPKLSALLMSLYMIPAVCIAVIMGLNYSQQGNLLPVYQALPLERPGNILLGALKAVYFKYFLPIFLSLYLVYVILVGTSLIPDLLLSLSFSTLFIVIYYRFSNVVFPFSKEKSTRESGGMLIKMLGTMLLLILMGVCHHLLGLIPGGVLIAIPFCWLLIYFTARQIVSLSITKIESHY